MKFRVSLPSCTPAIPFSSPIKFLAKLDIYIYIYNATCDDSGSLSRTYLPSIPLSVSVFTFLSAFNTRTLYREGKFLITVVYILIARISRIR